MEQTITLQLIVDRDRMQDPFDGSWWYRGEVRKLLSEHAERLLKHPDCWKQTRRKAALVLPLKQEEEDDEELDMEEDLQYGMPQLADMTMDQLVQFAKAQFNKDLNPAKMKKAELIEEVRNLIVAEA